MTETGCGGILTTASDIKRSEKYAYESIGKVSPFIEVKIVDQSTGKVVPRSVDGEIWIRSRFIMKMYWGDPEKTAESIDENGWFKTGDIGMAKKMLFYFNIILNF
jgi:long-subunit acyl-CoA synthetase (AMP-forming)